MNQSTSRGVLPCRVAKRNPWADGGALHCRLVSQRQKTDFDKGFGVAVVIVVFFVPLWGLMTVNSKFQTY